MEILQNLHSPLSQAKLVGCRVKRLKTRVETALLNDSLPPLDEGAKDYGARDGRQREHLELHQRLEATTKTGRLKGAPAPELIKIAGYGAVL